MFDIDWSSVLVSGSAISVGLIFGVCLFVGICGRIARAICDRADRKTEYLIAETPDEVFIDAIRRYEGQ